MRIPIHPAYRSGALLTLGILATACGPRPERGSMAVSRDSLCAGIDNTYECGQAVEAARLGGEPAVTRSGDTLILALAAGDVIRLVDHDAGGADNLFYTYRRHLDGIGYHVVDLHFWEGGAHVLIDDSTGERTRVSGPPVVSPDGRRLVVASAAGVAGYAPNELQVWRVTPDGLELEWEVTPGSWGAEDPRWEDARTVRFQRSTQDCDEEPICFEPAVLRLEGESWEVTGS